MAGVETAGPVGGYDPRPPSRGSRPSSRVYNTGSPLSHTRRGSGGGASHNGSATSPSHTATSSARERPPSVRSLQEKKELSEYLSPVVKSAVRRWKRFHEQRVLDRFKERKEIKRQRIDNLREEKKRLARRIPIDILALEWLNDNKITVDARAYLLEKLLPTLILGVEKLLNEAERRGLTETIEADPNFNPINYLAQYLMRNNPRYSNFPEASPYIRGIREVTEELKKHVFSFEDNRLAKIKAEARRKREEQEILVALKDKERGRRSAKVRGHYSDWLLEEDGEVELHFIQTALRSFSDVVETLPEELQKAAESIDFSEDVDNTQQKLSQEDFVEYLRKHVTDLSPDFFNELMNHLSNCATAFKHAAILEARRDILSTLFNGCDHAGVGILDRHRVLSLFENFYEEAPWVKKRYLRNPRKWPVIELEEVVDTESMVSENSTTSSAPSSAPSTPLGTTKPEIVDEGETQEPVGSEPTAEQKEKSEEDKTVTEGDPPKELEEVPSDVPENSTVPPQGDQPTSGEKGAEEGGAEETPAVEVKAEGQESATQETVEPSQDSGTNAEETEKAEDAESKDQVEEKPLEETKAEEPNPVQESPDAAPEESKLGETSDGTQVVENEEIKPSKEEAADAPATGQLEEDSLKALKNSALDPQSASDSSPKPLTAAGRQTSVSFHEEAIQHKEKKTPQTGNDKTPVKTPTTQRSGSVAASAFDENSLNESQFIQLIEVFLGQEPPQELVVEIIDYIKTGYVETEEEKFLRLQVARKEAQTANRKALFQQLFEKWDNDGSGYLDFDELMSVISKFKDNMEAKVMAKAKQKIAPNIVDNRLSQVDFKDFISEVCSLLPGGEDNFDPLVDFLMTSIERSYEERIRGQARKKWLAQIIHSAETSGASLGPVYKSMFNALYKDCDQHGRGKRISANVALLERSDSTTDHGKACLRYVAATPDDSYFLINRVLYRDMKGISFAAVDSGKPIHVPRVQNHGNIMFWNPERSDEERQGSFIVIPLKDLKKRVFGVMGIDTLNDMQEKSIFITHEIGYFQGVAKAFSTAYQYVDVRRKTLRITESALSWIHRRSPHVEDINVYIVEPDEKEFILSKPRRQPIKNKKMLEIFVKSDLEKQDDFVLRKMMGSNKNGHITVMDIPSKLERKENLFRDYLFRCVDNSETITADAYGQRHTAFPLRDIDGRAVAVIDISIGELKSLPSHENKEVQRMLKLLQAAHKELASESEGEEKKVVLEAEKGSDESRIDIMFDRIMLTDLRDTVGKLTTRAFAELKSYKDPPKVIHQIVSSVLTLFYKEKADEGELEVWNTCKQIVSPELVRKIQEFDPTASDAVSAVELISKRLADVPHGAVAKHGSLPAQYLYNWCFVCLSLLEHTSKMQGSPKPGIATPNESVQSNAAEVEQ